MNAILTYHSIDDSGSVLSTPPALFAAHMQTLADHRVQVVPLERILTPDVSIDRAQPQVAITFDDGFANVYEHAWPALQRHDFPATVFIVTEYVGHSNDWPDQPSGLPRLPLLGWSQVQAMTTGGVRFGAHTLTHPNLTHLSPAQADAEMLVSRQQLEDVVSEPITTFAYPYGACNALVRDLAAKHFSLACTTDLAYVQADSHSLALPRLDMYYLQRPEWLRCLFTAPTRTYIALRRGVRRARASIAGSRWPLMPPIPGSPR